MKYLKNFENSNYCYWLLPTDSRFERALKKIGCEEPDRNHFLKNDRLRKFPYVFISKNFIPGTAWGWDIYNGDIEYETYNSKGLKFNGIIDIPEYELVAIKYNL